MNTIVTILETNFNVDWTFDITAHGNGGCAPSLSYPGDPPEPAEFEIEILGIERASGPSATPLDLPEWLKTEISEYLYNRNDINEIVQRADQERGSYDPDDL